jgi:hypothetical protein
MKAPDRWYAANCIACGAMIYRNPASTFPHTCFGCLSLTRVRRQDPALADRIEKFLLDERQARR